MKVTRIIGLLLLCLLFFNGCSGSKQSTPASSPTPSPTPSSTTPELAGGSENENRPQKTMESMSGDAVNINKTVYHSGPSGKKIVALTFDDGPDNKFTLQILDILKQNNVKATFFIVGSRAKAHPDIVKQIAAEGHAIGNHSWDHPDFEKLSEDQVIKQVNDTQNELQDLLGYKPSIMRPPYGALNPAGISAINGLGLKIVDWSVDTRDWAGTPAPEILKLVHKELKPGGIILQHCAGGKHDSLANTVAALKELIPELKKEGYTFVTIPDLLDIAGSNPS